MRAQRLSTAGPGGEGGHGMSELSRGSGVAVSGADPVAQPHSGGSRRSRVRTLLQVRRQREGTEMSSH